jgi:hypothetical protein
MYLYFIAYADIFELLMLASLDITIVVVFSLFFS